MSIFEYRCKDCGTSVQAAPEAKATMKSKAKCPKCGSTNTGRVFSLFGRMNSPVPVTTRRRG